MFELEVFILNPNLLKNIDLKLIYIHIQTFFDFDCRVKNVRVCM